jgi:hypothetical protein
VKLAPSILITVADLTAFYDEDITDPLITIRVLPLEEHVFAVFIVGKMAAFTFALFFVHEFRATDYVSDGVLEGPARLTHNADLGVLVVVL